MTLEGDEKDETVYFHQQHGEKHQKPHVRKPLKSVGTTPADAKVQPRRDEEMLGAKANKTVGEVKASLDDVETPSDIFSGDEEFLTPEKSISVSALESLPPLTPSVSVIGSALDLGDQPQRSAIESVDLDIEGQSSRGDALKSDADLGSFLKKLPR